MQDELPAGCDPSLWYIGCPDVANEVMLLWYWIYDFPGARIAAVQRGGTPAINSKSSRDRTDERRRLLSLR
jgi:hypothetical protein